MAELPSGTVTFLFTDTEGSTRLLHEVGPEAYAQVLDEHRHVVRDACSSHGGVEVDTQGDAFFVAFPSAPGALEAARAITEGLSSGPIQQLLGEERYELVRAEGQSMSLDDAGEYAQQALARVSTGLPESGSRNTSR